VASTRVSRRGRTVIGLIVVASALLLSPLAAHATPDPTPTTTAGVNAKLADLAKANEQLTEKYNKAQIDVAKSQAAASAATKEAAAAQDRLRHAQTALAASLSSQYKAASFSKTAALLSSQSGQNYLETMESLSLLSTHQTEIAKAAATATEESRKAEAAAKDAVATAIARREDVSRQRDALQPQIDKYKALLATLTAAERARYYAAVTPTPAPSQVAQVVATPVVAAGPVSKNAAGAVQAALAQRGKPYVWGAAGPDSFDCSGLTMFAWGQAGVSLPHQSAEQQAMGTPVDRSALQPGDLVFFGSPAYHVGMYIGGGMFVHAPTSGDVVKISPLSMMSDYSGATRVG
jgi:cell wall-associated NlpC family hydrolase